MDRFPWRQELAAWEDGFAGRLPAGLRAPPTAMLRERAALTRFIVDRGLALLA